MLLHRSLRIVAGFAAIFVLSVSPAPLRAGTYTQTNLVSDIPRLATLTDPNLVDPWGVASSATGPFWISDNHTNLTTLYSGTPSISALVVSVPGGPTGQVNNTNTSAFLLPNNRSANSSSTLRPAPSPPGMAVPAPLRNTPTAPPATPASRLEQAAATPTSMQRMLPALSTYSMQHSRPPPLPVTSPTLDSPPAMSRTTFSSSATSSM